MVLAVDEKHTDSASILQNLHQHKRVAVQLAAGLHLVDMLFQCVTGLLLVEMLNSTIRPGHQQDMQRQS